MTDPVDLAECAREPIHIPGAVQPNGVLIAVSDPELRITQISASVENVVGRAASSLLGHALCDLLDVSSLGLPPVPAGEALGQHNPVHVEVAGRPFEAVLHRSGERLIVELEPALKDEQVTSDARDVYHRLNHALRSLRAAESSDELFAMAAREVRALSGFDRVMIYRFETDGHGVVIAEARAPELEPYLGLHYPESDIPAQARQLYALNPVRLITDTHYRPSPLVPLLDPGTNAPLDLSWSILRTVSPVHIEYLENMGVRASMSISLLQRSRLWGLVACHHRTPHFVGYETRLACEIFAQVLAWEASLVADREREHARASASAVHVRIVQRMTTSGLVEGLMHGTPNVLDLVSAGGAALWRDGVATTVGTTPSEAQIAELVRWLRSVQDGDVYQTNRLASFCPLGEEIKEVASGVLAVAFAGDAEHVLVWFRPEVPQTVRWAGDPNQALERNSGTARISPRRSFATFIEQIRGTAVPWQETEIERVVELRAAIVTLVLRNAAVLARLNAELREAVLARDEFLSMASHELRTPLSTLELQVEALARLRASSPELGLGSERFGKSLSMARRQLSRLEQLVAEMLDVARLSSGGLKLAPTEGVDLNRIVREVLARFADKLSKIHVDVRADGDLVGCWDASRLDQVVTNLVSNAIKYGNELPITIELHGHENGVELVVQDRGTGLSAAEQRNLFSRFQRDPSTERRYSGFGLGLWIVRMLVEAHGGSVFVESQLGHGATFRARLPRRAESRRITPPAE